MVMLSVNKPLLDLRNVLYFYLVNVLYFYLVNVLYFYLVNVLYFYLVNVLYFYLVLISQLRSKLEEMYVKVISGVSLSLYFD